MEKKILRLISVFAVIAVVLTGLLAFSACNSDDEGGDPSGVVYTLSGDGEYYIVTGYTGTSTEVSLKNSYDGKPVKEVGERAFANNIEITSVSFRSNMLTIGNGAFLGCISLKTAELPKKLVSIGEQAFYGCQMLETVTIPSTVTAIGRDAFYGCSTLVLNCSVFSQNKPLGWVDGWNGSVTPNWKPRVHSYEFVTSYVDAETGEELSGSALVKNLSERLETIPVSTPMPGYAFTGWYDNAEFSGSPVEFPYTDTAKYVLYAKYEKLNIEILSYEEIAELLETEGADPSLSESRTNIVNCVVSLAEDCAFVAASENEAFAPVAINIPALYDEKPVIAVDDEAFMDVSSLISVNLESESNLRILGERAFYNTSLEVYKINNALWYVGKEALSNVETLKSIEVFDDNESFRSDVALYDKNCTKLIQYPIGKDPLGTENAEFALPSSVTEIADGAFFDSNLTSIDFSAAVNLVKIGERAFSKCSAVRISLPSAVTNIGKEAFKNSSLTAFVFSPSAVNYTIPESMFEGCASLSELVIPTSVSVIGERAFYGCTSLVKVEQDPQTVERIEAYAFFGCSSLKEYNISEKVTDPVGESVSYRGIGYGAFGCCDELNLTISPENTRYVMDENGILYNAAKTELLYYPISAKSQTAVIPESVDYICDYAFACSGLREINVPSGVQRLNVGAFWNSALLTVCNFAETNSLTYIGEECFYGCEELWSVVVPSGITDIGKRAFKSKVGMNIFIGRKNEALPEGWVEGWDEDSDVFWEVKKRNYIFVTDEDGTSLGTPVEAINDYIIATQPISVPYKTGSFIGWYTNEEKTGDMVHFPFYTEDEETDVYLYAAYEDLNVSKNDRGQYTLTGYATPPVAIYVDVTYGSGEDEGDVVKIAPRAFKNCQSLVKVVLSDHCKITEIGEEAFAMTLITEITVSAKVATIGKGAFADSRLERVSFAAGSVLNTISEQAFKNTSIYEVEFPNSLIYLSGFESTDLTEITVTLNVNSIGENAFSGCEALEKVHFVENAKLVSIGKNAFADTAIAEIAFPWKLEKVDGFRNAPLASIIITDSIKEIAAEAFYGCSKLSSVSISRNCELSKIGTDAFFGTPIASIALTNTLTDISENAFRGCENLIIYCEISMDKKPAGWADNWAAGRTVVWNRTATVFNFSDQRLEPIKSFILDVMPISVPDDGGFVGWVKNSNLTGSVITFPYSSDLEEMTLYAKYTDLLYSDVKNDQEETIGYAVTGYNKAKGTPVYITVPATHNEKPVLEINKYAFSGCTSLTNIVFAEGSNIKEIGEYAFENTMISEITLPASLTTVGNGVFRYCSKLTSIKVEESNENFKSVDGVMYDKAGELLVSYPYGATELLFLAGVKKLADYVFYGMKITSVILPDSIESLGNYAFFGCIELTSVSFGTNSALKYIGKRAFESSGITSIAVPVGVKEIDDYAFNNCIALSSLTFGISAALERMGNFAFANAEVAEVRLPAALKRLGNSAFDGCKYLTKVDVYEGVEVIGASAFKGTKISSVNLPATVAFIGDYAFYQCSLLKSAEIAVPSSIVYIGNYAFAETALEEMTVPIKSTSSSLEDAATILSEITANEVNIAEGNYSSIGDYAFYRCTKLTTVYLGSGAEGMGVKYIGKYAFGSAALRSVTIPDSVESIGEGAFNNYSTLTSVNFINGGSNSSLKYLGKDAFLSSELVSVYLPKGITGIEKQAFYNYPSLSTVIIADGEEDLTIGENAFGLSKLNSIHIPSRTTKIGNYAFCDCSELSSVTIGENSRLTEIGGYSFQNTAITTITIPDGVTTIGEYAFDRCVALERVIISEDSQLESIHGYAFSRSGLIASTEDGEVFVVPAKVTNIGIAAFRNCVALTAVSFADGSEIVNVGAYAFARTRITNLVIPNKTDIIFEESALSGCAYLVNLTVPFIGTSIDAQDKNAMFSTMFGGVVPASLKTVVITNAVKLQSGAFADCVGVTEITVPVTVTTIETGAFTGSHIGTVVIDSQSVASSCAEASSCGELLSSAVTVYVNSGIADTEYGDYLTNAYSVTVSDREGYTKLTKN